MSFKLNKNDLKNLQREIDHAVDTSTKETFDFFKKETPKKSGNARRNTKYKIRGNNTQILGDYDYSGALDAGRSKQAPKGMTKPSLKKLRSIITKEFRKI
tara:strand:+ start:250 stop:549 length:300 start_codon:yes stop_codon:yes gene_type:complete